MKKYYMCIFILCFIVCVGCYKKVDGSNKDINIEISEVIKEEPVIDKGVANETTLDVIVDASKDNKALLEPIYIDIISPDEHLRLIFNDIGLMLSTKEYKVIDIIIEKEQMIGEGIDSCWSEDSSKIVIAQYGEEFSSFFLYAIVEKYLSPLKDAEGLDKTDILVDSVYDWFPATSVIRWLNDDELLFSVLQLESSNLGEPTLRESGYRSDLYKYVLSKNTFINLTNSMNGEYYYFKEISGETITIDLYIKDDKIHELIYNKSFELKY